MSETNNETLLRLLYETHAVYEAIDKSNWPNPTTVAFDNKFDDLIGFVCDHFAPSEFDTPEFHAERAETLSMMADKFPHRFDVIPPLSTNAAIGFGALRSCLAVRNYKLNPPGMKNFARLAAVFEPLIIGTRSK